MNKFERQSRQPADAETLPADIADELSRIPTEVIDIGDAPPIAPPPPLSSDEVRTIEISLMLSMVLAALVQTICWLRRRSRRCSERSAISTAAAR